VLELECWTHFRTMNVEHKTERTVTVITQCHMLIELMPCYFKQFTSVIYLNHCAPGAGCRVAYIP